MGRKEIETEANCEEENKPEEVEQVTNRSPVGAVDVFWVHLYSLRYQVEPPPPTVKTLPALLLSPFRTGCPRTLQQTSRSVQSDM